VHGSSLISQLWSPKVPISADDGYSSPKSEKDSEGGEDEDDEEDGEQTEAVIAKKPSWLMTNLMFCCQFVNLK
jgi:hypothetical protein